MPTFVLDPMNAGFTLTLYNASEVPITGVETFLNSSPRAVELFHDRDEMARWIVSRLKLGRYELPLLFMHNFETIGGYNGGDWAHILSKILSHTSLTNNTRFLIKNSPHACSFMTTYTGIKIIETYYPVHRWLFSIYEKYKHMTPQFIMTYTAILKVITMYQIPKYKCMEVLKEILSRTTHSVAIEMDETRKNLMIDIHSTLWKDVIEYYFKHCVDTKEELVMTCQKLSRAVFYKKLEKEICSARDGWTAPSPQPVQNF